MSPKPDTRPLSNAEAREKRQAEAQGRMWRRHGGPVGDLTRVTETRYAFVSTKRRGNTDARQEAE